MPVVDRISPGRGRSGDSASLFGEFGANGNLVTFGGISAAISVDTAAQLDLTIPAGLPLDQFVEVVVTDTDDGSTVTWWYWVKDSIANLATKVLRFKVPFRDEIAEGLTTTNMRRVEAKYFERLVSSINLLS